MSRKEKGAGKTAARHHLITLATCTPSRCTKLASEAGNATVVIAAQADRDADPLTIGGRISGDDGTIGSGQPVGGSECGAGPPARERQALFAGKPTADCDC